MEYSPFISALREWTHADFAEHGKTYGDQPYGFHIDEVLGFAHTFFQELHTAAVVRHPDVIYGGALVHDSTEDLGRTHGDLVKKMMTFPMACLAVAEEIAHISVACQNHPGRDRIERGVPTWVRLRHSPIPKYVKLCDRMSNMQPRGERMPQVYLKEFPVFEGILRIDGQFESMWAELHKLADMARNGKGQRRWDPQA